MNRYFVSTSLHEGFSKFQSKFNNISRTGLAFTLKVRYSFASLISSTAQTIKLLVELIQFDLQLISCPKG